MQSEQTGRAQWGGPDKSHARSCPHPRLRCKGWRWSQWAPLPQVCSSSKAGISVRGSVPELGSWTEGLSGGTGILVGGTALYRRCLKQRRGVVPSTSLPVAESGQRSLDKKAWGVRFSEHRIQQRRAGKDRKSRREMPGTADGKCLEQTGSAWNSKQEVPGTANWKCLEQQTGNAWNG